MQNPKSDARNPNAARRPKSEATAGAARSVLACGAGGSFWRGAPPGNRSADFQSAVSRVSNPQTVRADQRLRYLRALPTASRRDSRLPIGATGERRSGWLALAFCFLCSILCLPSSAQYALNWWTVDGGGDFRGAKGLAAPAGVVSNRRRSGEQTMRRAAVRGAVRAAEGDRTHRQTGICKRELSG